METVQLQCGHCKEVMAIGVEHLGGQVQCPHCKGVVQTPARASQPEAPAVAPMPNTELQQHESIFGGAEASDMVIGESAAPKVEMPFPSVSDAPAAPMDAASATEDEPDADLTKFKPRPVYDKSVVSLYGFIFLVPYAILTTGIILYLVFVQGGRTHPFDMLPDPVPGKDKGGPKHTLKIVPTLPLADHQRIELGKSITVGKDGDLVVTPERVRLTEVGDLQIFLRAKNVSTDTTFDPINELYVRHDLTKPGGEPYSFLETKSGKVRNIYNATLEYSKNANDKNLVGSALLAPGGETTIILTTGSEYRTPDVAAIVKANDRFTWRVQLRRGFVKWRGKEVPATAVIGVEFSSAQIERKG